jgi:hypothetical protein
MQFPLSVSTVCRVARSEPLPNRERKNVGLSLGGGFAVRVTLPRIRVHQTYAAIRSRRGPFMDSARTVRSTLDLGTVLTGHSSHNCDADIPQELESVSFRWSKRSVALGRGNNRLLRPLFVTVMTNGIRKAGSAVRLFISETRSLSGRLGPPQARTRKALSQWREKRIRWTEVLQAIGNDPAAPAHVLLSY